MIQIKKDEKSLRTKEGNGDETKKGIRVCDGIKRETYHESRGQIIDKKDIGLPGRVRRESISPSG